MPKKLQGQIASAPDDRTGQGREDKDRCQDGHVAQGPPPHDIRIVDQIEQGRPSEEPYLRPPFRDEGHEVWLELGLQSAFDATLERVNRGHGFAEYRHAVRAARRRGLPVCTHLIAGLPGEGPDHALTSLRRVIDEGVDGLKLHPLHVVRGTRLANEWRRGEYRPLGLDDYLQTAAELVAHTPPEIVYHRLTGTASPSILLAPGWCSRKWMVIDGIALTLARQGRRQGSALDRFPHTLTSPENTPPWSSSVPQAICRR